MASNIGLYYPFIEFQNDKWIKLAALYWDKMGRIALPEYSIHDSDTVQQLRGELDFIKDFQPTSEEIQGVGSRFLTLLQHHQQELFSRYGYKAQSYYNKVFGNGVEEDRDKYFELLLMLRGQSWPSPEEVERLWSSPLPSSFPPQPAFIFPAGRMTPELLAGLRSSGLVFEVDTSARESKLLLGIHPKLAFIYMAALAEEMAANRQFYPVTESVLEHLAVNGCTLERLAHVLLSDKEHENTFLSDPSLTEREVETQVATIALRSVVPRNIDAIPVAKIIKFRKQYGRELEAFQTYLQEFTTSVAKLRDVTDLTALQAHLEVEYEKQLKPQIEDLKECLRSLSIETIFSAINIRVALPALVASGGAYLSQLHLGPTNPILIGAGAAVFSLLPVIRDKGKEAKEKLRSSPAAYLLRVEESLEPTTLASQIAQQARRLFFRI
jgi:hypothetical protein